MAGKQGDSGEISANGAKETEINTNNSEPRKLRGRTKKTGNPQERDAMRKFLSAGMENKTVSAKETGDKLREEEEAAESNHETDSDAAVDKEGTGDNVGANDESSAREDRQREREKKITTRQVTGSDESQPEMIEQQAAASKQWKEWMESKGNEKKCNCQKLTEEMFELAERTSKLEEMIIELLEDKSRKENQLDCLLRKLTAEREEAKRLRKEDKEVYKELERKLEEQKKTSERNERKLEDTRNQISMLKLELSKVEANSRRMVESQVAGLEARQASNRKENSRNDINHNMVNEKRNGMASKYRKPKKLEDIEVEKEMAWRVENKNNILIRRVNCRSEGELQEVVSTIRERLGVTMVVTDVWETDEGLVVRVADR